MSEILIAKCHIDIKMVNDDECVAKVEVSYEPKNGKFQKWSIEQKEKTWPDVIDGLLKNSTDFGKLIGLDDGEIRYLMLDAVIRIMKRLLQFTNAK